MKREMTAVYRYNQYEKVLYGADGCQDLLIVVKEVEEGAHRSPGNASHLKSHTVLTDPKIKNTTKLESVT